MSEKYTGLIGRLHLWKEGAKERWRDVKEEGGLGDNLKQRTDDLKEKAIRKINHGDEEYDHLFRKKSRWELVRISAAVMGIEFSYAVETAFVSPTLLKIGELKKELYGQNRYYGKFSDFFCFLYNEKHFKYNLDHRGLESSSLLGIVVN